MFDASVGAALGSALGMMELDKKKKVLEKVMEKNKPTTRRARNQARAAGKTINEDYTISDATITVEEVKRLFNESDLTFLDELSDDADDYEVEKFDSDEDEGCEGGACKI